MIGIQQKNCRILCYQHYHLIDKPVITFYGCEFICISELSWNFLKNINAQVIEFFSFLSFFYFYLVCFTFSISYSGLQFHLVSVFQFLLLFFFFFLDVLSQEQQKSFCMHIYNMHNIYIFENMNFCLTKRFMTF